MENKIEVIKAIIGFQSKVPKIELNSEVTVKTKSDVSGSLNDHNIHA